MTSPDQHESDDVRRGGLVRRVLNQGPSAEQRLEELLAQRRSELEAHAARLRESIEELERREELLRDSRASVERMLRLGTSDLEAREAELTDFLSGLTAARGGAHGRRKKISRVADRSSAPSSSSVPRSSAVSGRWKHERATSSSARRRSRSGQPLRRPSRSPSRSSSCSCPESATASSTSSPSPLTRGYAFDVEGVEYAVARIGRSPLPGDDRRCAYLVRGRDEGGSTSSDGSS